MWMGPTLKVLTLQDRRIIEDQRISVERPYTRDWNLHIREVRRNDSGEYKCQISTNPPKSTKIILMVQGGDVFCCYYDCVFVTGLLIF